MTTSPVAESLVKGRVVGIVAPCLVSTAITVSLGIGALMMLMTAGL